MKATFFAIALVCASCGSSNEEDVSSCKRHYGNVCATPATVATPNGDMILEGAVSYQEVDLGYKTTSECGRVPTSTLPRETLVNFRCGSIQEGNVSDLKADGAGNYTCTSEKAVFTYYPGTDLMSLKYDGADVELQCNSQLGG